MQRKTPAHQRNEDNFDTRAVCWGLHGRGAAPTSCITNLLNLQMVCFGCLKAGRTTSRRAAFLSLPSSRFVYPPTVSS